MAKKVCGCTAHRKVVKRYGKNVTLFLAKCPGTSTVQIIKGSRSGKFCINKAAPGFDKHSPTKDQRKKAYLSRIRRAVRRMKGSLPRKASYVYAGRHRGR